MTVKSPFKAGYTMRYADIRDIVLYREQHGNVTLSLIVVSKDKIYLKSLEDVDRLKDSQRMLVLGNRRKTRELLYQALTPRQQAEFGYQLLKTKREKK